MTSPLEAMAALQNEQTAIDEHHQNGMAIGQRMLDVLVNHGEILIARWGMYGGTPGLIGSSNPGLRVTQSTLPVEVGDGSFVALRHPTWIGFKDLPGYDIELVRTENSGVEYCAPVGMPSGRYEAGTRMAEHERQKSISYTEDDVIAGFFKNGRRDKKSGLVIAGKDTCTKEQAEAITVLVDHIALSTQAIDENQAKLTRELPYTPQMFEHLPIRHGANSINDVDLTRLQIYVR